MKFRGFDGDPDLSNTGSYILGPGWRPNPVFEAVAAYLDSAEILYAVETAKNGWLDLKTWFVIHHLSVLATELFLKSFHVTVKHGPVTSPDGPDEMTYAQAFGGHKPGLEAFPQDVVDSLKSHLPARLFDLMGTLSTAELNRGRYPFEADGDRTRFPLGDDGRVLAESWLNLARTLSTFQSPPVHLGVPD